MPKNAYLFLKPKYMKKIILGVFILILNACGSSEQNCNDSLDLTDVQVEVEVIRLEQEIFKLKDKNEIRAFLEKYSDFAEKFMQRKRLPHDSIAVDQIYTMLQEPHQDTVYQDVQQKFGDLSNIKQEFEEAFKHIKYYYPEFKAPKIYTVTTGLGLFFGGDLYVSPELIVISLEFFIGAENRYRPNIDEIPDYIWRRYYPEAIVPNCIQYISNGFNKTDFSDKTTVAEMIYYGKAYEFTKKIMPCLPDSTLFGYTASDMRNLAESRNREFIWNHFIEKQILFNTNQKTINEYLGESPYNVNMGKEVPGRIGRWLGWKIIQKYKNKNPDITFQQLMDNPNARDIFNKSGYKGD